MVKIHFSIYLNIVSIVFTGKKSLLDEKLVLEKGKVAAHVFTEPIQFIINVSEVLGSSKKKQEVDSDLL